MTQDPKNLALPSCYADNNIEVVQISTDTFRDADARAKAESLRLFDEMYDGLYSQTFPSDERIPKKRCMELLNAKDDDGEIKRPICFMLFVQNKGKKNEKILGLAGGTFWTESKVGLITYLARENAG